MSHRPQEPEPVPEGAVPEPEQDLPAAGTAEARRAGGEGPGPDAAGGPAPPGDEHAAVLAELEDRWRRALADLDNLRKRHARELERERAAERARTATALLPVIDNLELALSHAEADPATIVEGVKAVRDQAVDALDEAGAAGGGGGAGDDGAAAAAQFDQALFAEPLVAAQDGVHIDAEGVGEGAGGGEAFAGVDRTVGDGTAYGGGDLVAERDRGAGVDREQHVSSRPPGGPRHGPPGR